MFGDDEVSPPLLTVGRTNIADLIAEHAAERPHVVALVQPSAPRRELTWAALEASVDALASGLATAGLVAGHRVAICGVNSVEFVLAYFAALRAGFVAVPLNPTSTPDEVRQLVADSGSRVLFSDEQWDVPGVRVVPLTPAGLADLAAPATHPVSSPRDAEALAVLLFTAGTSAGPKAAMLTHRALLAHLEHVQTLEILGPQTHILAVLPLFHVFGLNAVLGSWARSGARLVVVAGLGDDFSTLLHDEAVTNLPLAPAVIHRLLEDPRFDGRLGPVDTVLSGAAPLPEQLRTDFTARTGLRVDQGYGLTEAAPGVTATLGGSEGAAGNDVGRALPGVELRIEDGADPGEPGEIWIRGDNLFSGYWPDGSGGPGEDGWFATGDIGYLADDHLFLVDRSRELVIVNGFNVFPAEVEQVISELPGVVDVAVIGAPDPRTGEHVVAFVTGAGITEEEILAHCDRRLARFKRPVVVQVLAELPRGATGKVKKGALRNRLGAAVPG